MGSPRPSEYLSTILGGKEWELSSSEWWLASSISSTTDGGLSGERNWPLYGMWVSTQWAMRSSEAPEILAMGSGDAVCSVMMSTYEKVQISGPLTNGDVSVDLSWEMAARACEAKTPESTP